ncbi:hypothetical protein HJFPF1_03604 [Paramyrothecium foliicola]|nr:hypothetical protein HJFPF1_03604 [Paramyrothecium foliicola]
MAKKRKAAGRDSRSSGPKELNPADARLGPITTYEDVADSEDEYFINKDKIMLEDEPRSKRRRRDDDIEMSDEEVLGYDDESDEDDFDDPEGEEEVEQQSRKSQKPNAKGKVSEDADGDEEEGDPAWWGSSRKEYYDADKIETEADALEEEVEAKRLQKKKLSKMAEEDFVFDGDEWLAAEPEGEDEQDAVVEVLKDVEISEDMSPEERYELLQARYPEFEHLVSELQELQPALQQLKTTTSGPSGTPLETLQYRILGCYVAALASYLAILTSPARDDIQTRKTIDPSELREHEVMETLMSCRDAWQRVKQMRSLGSLQDESPHVSDIDSLPDDTIAQTLAKPAKKRSSKNDKVSADKKAKLLAKAKAAEASVADLYDLPLSRSTKKSGKQSKLAARDDEDNSDFGEEAVLDARTAADKAARKKSLKFYTSQIVQKSNRRADAGRDAGGDMDIPHRERLRDRQARLMAEAERRGKKDSKHGAALGDDSDADDTTAANALRDDEDEYYDMVAQKSKSKKDDKAARYAAYAAASKADRVVETEELGEDGKRKITYAIEKNKGLAPKRSKDVRNPRVKKRKQYEAKQKKLRSMKPVWKGGEPKGGYQGELSGINVSVIKSTKL